MMDIKRRIASKDGALIAATMYLIALVVLMIYKMPIYAFDPLISTILVPANLFLGLPESSTLLLGVPVNLLVISFVMYTTTGYLIDWFYKPYR